MTELVRLRCTWGGSPVVGPGLSTFYATTGGSGLPDDVLTFFNTSPLLFPSGLTITVPSGGETINDATGELTGTWNEPGTGGVATGTETGSYAKGVGMQVRWPTAGIVGGRKVVGSTFLVPIAGSLFDVDGTIDTAVVSAMQSQANALLAAQPNLRIWSRPKGLRAGSSHTITSAVIPDRTSWLRTRRT